MRPAATVEFGRVQVWGYEQEEGECEEPYGNVGEERVESEEEAPYGFTR